VITALGRSSPIWQGGGAVGHGHYSGEIDTLRIWMAARSTEDISRDVDFHGCPSDPLLEACYTFEATVNDSATYIEDNSGHAVYLFTASAASPYRAYCVNIDDGGFNTHTGSARGLMWGFCGDTADDNKPKLPGSGAAYDLPDMQAIEQNLALQGIGALDAHVGCGAMFLKLTMNQALGFGGAVYYDSCGRLDKVCFLQGVEAHVGSNAVFISKNRASAGAAVYVDCPDLGPECANAFDKSNVFGLIPSFAKMHFDSNVASHFGDDVGTKPKELRWSRRSPHRLTLVPSRVAGSCLSLAAQDAQGVPEQQQQERLSLAVQPFDALGSVVRGIEDVIEIRMCATQDLCMKDTAFLPVLFVPFDKVTGVSQARLDFECLIGTSEIAVEVQIAASQVPSLRAIVRCGACRASEAKTHEGCHWDLVLQKVQRESICY